MSSNLKRWAAGLALVAAFALTGCQEKSESTGGTASAGDKAYPLEVCLVSGEKLGSMGEPVVFKHQGQEVKLCCKNCKPDFEKEPAKFMAKLAGK